MSEAGGMSQLFEKENQVLVRLKDIEDKDDYEI